MNKVGLWLSTLLLTAGFLGPANSSIRAEPIQDSFNLVTNGSFADGLSGWTIDNPGNLPFDIKSIDIDGPGPLNSSDAFFIQAGRGYGSPDAGISQSIKVASGGAYTFSANIAASYFPGDPRFINNLSGGIVTVTLDGKTIVSFDFTAIASNSWEYATLNTSFETASAGLMEIDSFRPYAADINSPVNYLDNVSLSPNSRTSGPVPEPATLLLLGSGLFGLSSYGRRKINRTKAD